MPNKVEWRGTRNQKEQPNSPEYEFSSSRSQCTRTFRGPYESLLAARPNPGDHMDDVESTFVVERVRVVRESGGVGTLTITLSHESPSYPDANEQQEPTYEVEWTQLERKLQQHPRYSSSGSASLTTNDLEKLAAWEADTNATTKATKRAALSVNAQNFAGKIERGQESYLIFTPVARKTSYSYAQPLSNSCGTIQSPPMAVPSGYTWLKTADRAIRTGRNGKWERVEEWTGADAWDTQIYS